jgi:hypothetical protein
MIRGHGIFGKFDDGADDEGDTRQRTGIVHCPKWFRGILGHRNDPQRRLAIDGKTNLIDQFIQKRNTPMPAISGSGVTATTQKSVGFDDILTEPGRE